MLPEEIKALRKRLGLSLEGFANRIGVSFTTCQRWESGKADASRLAVEKMKSLKREKDALDEQH